jgi:hypothetical protein
MAKENNVSESFLDMPGSRGRHFGSQLKHLLRKIFNFYRSRNKILFKSEGLMQRINVQEDFEIAIFLNFKTPYLVNLYFEMSLSKTRVILYG